MLSFSNPRSLQSDADSMFLDRWSPRAFACEPLADHQLRALFEAARWAPSCFNEQPWLFRYAQNSEQHRVFLDLLVTKNQQWAHRAPLLMFLATRNTFAASGRSNRHAQFDAGAAWMSLALQARKMGLHAHAMAGFDLERVYEVLNLSPDKYEVMAAIAVGRRIDGSCLPEDLQLKEVPNERKSLAEIAGPGPMPISS